MAFHSYFEATPPSRRGSSENEVPVLIFRPFGTVPKVIFKNVYVGEKITKSILLRNPNSEILEVELAKLPPSDSGLSFSSKKFQINPLQEITLEIELKPIKAEKSIYPISFKTNTKGRFGFSVVCSTVQKKPLRKKDRTTSTMIKSQRNSLKGNKTQNYSNIRKVAVTQNKSLVSQTQSFCSTSHIFLKGNSSLFRDKSPKRSVVSTSSSVQTNKENTFQMEGGIVTEDELRNCSSETYIVSPHSVSLSLKQASVPTNAVKSKIVTPTKEVSLFSDFILSPIQSCHLFQARGDSVRKTFTVSSPSLSISKRFEISPVNEYFVPHTELSAIGEDLGQSDHMSLLTNVNKIASAVDSVTSQNGSENTNCNQNDGSNMLDLKLSPIKTNVNLDISGISEFESVSGRLNNNLNIFGGSPPFSPIQVTKNCSVVGQEKPLRELRNFQNEFSFETSDDLNFKTPRNPLYKHSIFATSSATSSLKKMAKNIDDGKIQGSFQIDKNIEETFVSKPETKFDNNERDGVVLNSQGKGSGENKMNFKSCLTIQVTPYKTAELSVSSASRTYSMEECPDKDHNGQSSNYITISPPQKVQKENKGNKISHKESCNYPIYPINKPLQKKEEVKLASEMRKGKINTKEVQFMLPKLNLACKRKRTEERSKFIMDTDKILAQHSNPSYCFTATVANPFIHSTVFYDQQWFDDREKEFVRWLNVLLTPPEQLSSSDDMPKVDVAGLWKHCCNSEVAPAPSREMVSSRYLVNHRLDSLRRKACTLFSSSNVAMVLSKVVVHIEKGMLSFRKDRNIVRDISLKTSFIELLLCYNPLWLRIGLETVTGKSIALYSNSDRVGIVHFIAQNVLSDHYLVRKYAYAGVTNMFKRGYDDALKSHVLKIFFLLVYFLDYAKENKLIIHNPCLFCKNAEFKESRDLLLAFSRDFLGGIGDITRHLKNLGYVVKHKQTYLDEYNYAVTSLGSDLRDGIKLTKVAEIIVQESSLSTQLRTPAISKLQKMHNVKVALTALNKAGHQVEGDINAKDIVEGHREKTMSLLWQIIYKFQISRFTDASVKIQHWFRSLCVVISRRVWMRKILAKQKVIQEKASIVIQKNWRRYITQKEYKQKMSAAYKIQSWFKSVNVMKVQRRQFLAKKNATIIIQKHFRKMYAVRQRSVLFSQKKAVTTISVWYYNILLTRRYENYYKKLKASAVVIQRWYRATCIGRQNREKFLLYRNSALSIQRWYRNIKISILQRQNFRKQKEAAIIIQQWYRNLQKTTKMKTSYLLLKHSATVIQRWYRSSQMTIKQRKHFLVQKECVTTIQRWYRSTKSMKNQRMLYLKQKEAAMVIQRWYCCSQICRKQRSAYLLQRNSAFCIQRWYRRTKMANNERALFLKQKNAALVIQKWYSCTQISRKLRSLYLLQRNSAVIIQRWYRRRKLAISERSLFLKQEQAATLIQSWYYSTKICRKQRNAYLLQKNSASCIQRWYRRTKMVKTERALFLKQKNAALVIQRWYRCTQISRKLRGLYLSQRNSALMLQKWYRSMKRVKNQRMLFLKRKGAATTIQRWYRHKTFMKNVVERINQIKENRAAHKIQVWYRKCRAQKVHRLETRKHLLSFLIQKEAVSKIENWYYLILQRRRNADLQIRLQKELEESQRGKCATKIQALWRGYQARKLLLASNKLIGFHPSKKHVLDTKISLRSLYLSALESFLPNLSFAVLLSSSALIECCVRLSSEICEEFLFSPHLNTLIQILEDLNRSKPAEDVLSVLLKILMNILRHPLGIHKVLENQDIIPVLSILTQRWCLKRTEEIFCYLCTVWWLIALDPDAAQTLRNSKAISTMLTKCQALVKPRVLRSSITPVKKGPLECFPSPAKEARRSVTPMKKLCLPDPTPHWCLKRVNRPKTFENGLFAINEVLKKLDIKTA